PDPMWADAESRRWMLNDLAHHGAEPPREDCQGLLTHVEGAPVWIGPLDALPVQPAPVLLDVDLDYMLTAARHEGVDSPLSEPWCRPAALLERLRARGVRPEIFTIATSITGGFTPWQWRHLADELAGSDTPEMDPSARHPFRT